MQGRGVSGTGSGLSLKSGFAISTVGTSAYFYQSLMWFLITKHDIKQKGIGKCS